LALAIFTAPRASAAAPSTPEQVVKSPNRTKEVYTQSKQNPLTAYFGRLNNPDPTLAKFGGGQGFELFYNLRRQITELGGIVGQLVDDVLKRRPRIVPGDGSNKDSVAVADQVRRLWDDIPRKAVVLRKTVDTLITCGFAPMELVWSRDPSSRIVAPLGMRRPDGSRGPGLIDRPAQNFILDIDQQWRFLSTLDPFNGEAIEPLKFIFLVAGSSNTEHGESAFTDLYSAAWFYQQIRQMMLDAVEKYGRPVPHVLIPRTMRPEDIAREDQFYTEKFGCYTRDFHDGDKVIVDYPTMPLAAAGAAGKSEIEVLKFLQSTMYIHLLRTPQTQDATGGSRALETTRNAIKDLASLTYTDILIEGLRSCGRVSNLIQRRQKIPRRCTGA
jgi:hypothetical protein